MDEKWKKVVKFIKMLEELNDDMLWIDGDKSLFVF